MKYAQYTQPAKGDVYHYAYGLRNPYSCHLTLDEELFCSDNGPNAKFGGMIGGYNIKDGVAVAALVSDEDGTVE